MSADNGIYILKTKDGYRVAHRQAIDNLYYHPQKCCNKQIIIEDKNTSLEICKNCNKKIDWIKKDKINSQMLRDYFGDCKVFKTKKEALGEAIRLYNEIINSDYPILEYGIQIINYDEQFPK